MIVVLMNSSHPLWSPAVDFKPLVLGTAIADVEHVCVMTLTGEWMGHLYIAERQDRCVIIMSQNVLAPYIDQFSILFGECNECH